MALIFDEGNVWHFSINRKGPNVKEMLLILPNSINYFGYSDERGILYFFHSDGRKPITKFHKSLSKEGHKTIQKSKRNDVVGMEYGNGLLIGIWFWTFGILFQFQNHPSNELGELEPEEKFQTQIWSTKRSVWTKGPHLIGKDQQIFSYNTFEELTGIAFNRTSVMLVGGHVYDSRKKTIHRDKVFIVNIKNNIWTKYPDLPSNWYNSDTDEIKIVAALTFGKEQQRYIPYARHYRPLLIRNRS